MRAILVLLGVSVIAILVYYRWPFTPEASPSEVVAIPQVAQPGISGWEETVNKIPEPGHDVARQFLELLKEERFEEAVDLYLENSRVDREMEAELKRLYYQVSYLNKDTPELIIPMANAWLAHFYGDAVLLMRLADGLRLRGDYHQALETLYTARTQSDQGESNIYRAALARLVQNADSQYMQNRDYMALVDFYQQALYWGFDDPAYRFRLAELFYLMGDPDSARQLLDGFERGSAWDRKVTALSTQLDVSGFEPENLELKLANDTAVLEVSLNYTHSLPASLDKTRPETLMSAETFQKLRRLTQLVYLGEESYVSGEQDITVRRYQVATLSLGSQLLPNIEVLVLPKTHSIAAGMVLGANVLDQFDMTVDEQAGTVSVQRRDER